MPFAVVTGAFSYFQWITFSASVTAGYDQLNAKFLPLLIGVMNFCIGLQQFETMAA